MRPDWLRSALLLLGMLTWIGCAPRTTNSTNKVGEEITQEDVLSQLPDRIRRESTPESLRALLQQVDTQLNGRSEGRPTFTAQQFGDLQQRFRLDEIDLGEIRRNDFTGLDVAYLRECLMFRDAVRALEMESYPPNEQATLLFEWTCRQIWPDRRIRPPAPAGYVARRGSGDGLERAYVFLATLQQAGLTGVLIGPPDAVDRLSFANLNPTDPNSTQPSPFWLVGVVVGKDVLLYDPWQSRPVPAPDGKGVATLAQLHAKPDAFADWLKDAKQIPVRDSAALAKTVAFAVVPLSALSPRLPVIEKSLNEALHVRLVVDVPAMMKTITDATGQPPLVWNPPTDSGSYLRALGRFLPTDEGGLQPTKPNEIREFQAYCFDIVPWGMFPRVLRELKVQGAIDIQQRIAGTFIGFVLEPNNNHEKLIRGHYNEVIRGLSQIREDAARFKDRADRETGLDQAVIDWVNEATSVYAELARTRRKETEDPVAYQAAQARVADFRRNKSEKFDMYVQKIAAEQILLEATYLVALCKLEQAERAQVRMMHHMSPTASERANVLEAWKSSGEWWQQFLRQHRDFESLYPGRFEQARKFVERTTTMVKANEVPS